MGEVLESLDEAGRQGRLAELAHHFFQASPWADADKAITYARQAGDRSLARFAHEDAVSQYEHALEALDLREPADEKQRREILLALGQRLALARELVRLAEQTGDRERAAWGHWWCALDLFEQGDIPGADIELATHAQLAAELRQPYMQWLVGSTRAMRAFLEGRIEESGQLAHQALMQGQQMGNQSANDIFGAQLLALRTEQGQLEELIPIVQGLVEQPPSLPAWRCALAYLYSELDRDKEARQELERIAAHDFTDLPEGVFWPICLAYLSVTRARLGDTRRAGLLDDLSLPYAGCSILLLAAVYHGSTDRFLASLAATLSRWEEAVRHFEAARAAYLKIGARPQLAHLESEYARMLLARGAPGDRVQARVLLARSWEAAESLGMLRLGEQVQALQASAAPAPKSPLPNGLTPREVDVLRLITGGRTNREIAEELVITVPTVERHISNLYTKIGARGRADATADSLKQNLV